jgi:hypothetical protein
MKKYSINENFLGSKVMGKGIGVVILDSKTSQKDLKKVMALVPEAIKVEEVKKDDSKEG